MKPTPLKLLLPILSLSLAALGAPILCVAGLGWTLLTALGAARPLRLYHLLVFSGIALATGASWGWCLLLCAPLTIAAIAATVSGPRYRGPGLPLLREKLQNNETSSPVVWTWISPQTSPQAALALDRAPASSPACAEIPVAG